MTPLVAPAVAPMNRLRYLVLADREAVDRGHAVAFRLGAGMNAYLAKPLDPSALAQVLGPAKIAEIIAGVAEDTRPYCERLPGARVRADLGEIRATAHALRGIATNLGLIGLARLTAAIEDTSQAGAGERVAGLCERVDACVAASIERLDALQAGGRR